MKNHFRRVLCALLALALCLPLNAMADVSITIIGEDGEQEVLQAAETEDQGNAREAFIDGIIDLAKEKFDEAGGQPQRAHYSGDIYVCKNFTVYLFRENRDRFRMAEYPDTPLVIPDNKPREECTDYVYGVEWKDVPASEGNPFYVAASFRYDPDKTQGGKLGGCARLSDAGPARGLFPDGGELLLWRGCAQPDLHRGLRPGVRQRHLDGQQHARRDAQRRALRLCAIRCGEGNRLVCGRVLP